MCVIAGGLSEELFSQSSGCQLLFFFFSPRCTESVLGVCLGVLGVCLGVLGCAWGVLGVFMKNVQNFLRA